MSQDPASEQAGRTELDATMIQPLQNAPAADAAEMTLNESSTATPRDSQSVTEIGLEQRTATSATKVAAVIAPAESTQTSAPMSPADVQTIVPQERRPLAPEAVETVIQPADGSDTQFETPAARANVRTAGGRRSMLKSFGDYEVIAEIARGGMGVVYRARQTRLNRVVAVKMILQGQLASDGDIQRFYSEAEAAARLEHPGIVPIYEVGEYEGQHYFSMGFVDGESLADRVRRGPLPARDAATLMHEVAEAIEYAHQHGIVHRDLKPGNILLTSDGHPRVTDFGLAKAIEQDSGLTASGQILGTPSYMPPEQAAGRIREVGPLSDVYSLGAVLYCLLVGRPPFQGVTVMETLKHFVESAPVSPRLLNPSVDRDLETICLKCLEKTPAHRLASAGELAAELQRYLAGEPIRSRRVNAATRVWRWCKRKPLAAALIASVVVLGIAIGAGFSLAKSASASREFVTLQTEFERTIDNAQLSEQWLKSADQLATRIAALPQQNERAPVDHASRITDAFVDLLQKELKRPKLSTEVAESLRASIQLLQGRAPSLADDLLTQLEGRLTDWVVDFELNAPQTVSTDAAATAKLNELLQKIFGESKVQIAKGAFLPKHSEKSVVAVVGMTARAAHADNATEIKYVVAPQTETLFVCRDDIELAGVFGPEWRTAVEVGFSLNSVGSRGYDFSIRMLDAPASTTSHANEDDVNLASSNANTKQFVAEVRRNRIPLLRRVLPADLLPTGPLQLRARRQRGDLEFQIHNLPPLRFTDPFALRPDSPGVFALRWPADVPLLSLTAQHRPRAVPASGLEQGDELFDAGKFAEAAEKYRQQVTEGEDESVQQEARYKLGACLTELQQFVAADEVFAPLVASSSGNWGALAGVQTLVSALRRNQPDEADSVIEILSSRFRFEELAVLVPSDLRDEILKTYAKSYLSLGGILQFDLNRMQKIERAAAIDRLLSPDGFGDFYNQMELMRVYHFAEKWPEALAVIEPLLKRQRSALVMRHFCRILRLSGQAKRAIEELDASLSGRVPMSEPMSSMLLLERARAHYMLGNIDNCEADLRAIGEPQKDEPFETYTQSARSVILGLLLDERGNVSAAHDIWSRAYARSQVLFDGNGKSYDTSLILALMLGSLSGELRESDASEFMRLVSTGNSSGSMVSMATSLATPQSIFESMRDMWRAPRGKQLARQFALEAISLRERTRLPLLLIGQAFLRQKAFESVVTIEQDQTLWELVNEGLSGVFETGKLKTSQLMQLALAWKGTTNFVGWSGVAPSLPPEFRAKAAWMLGHRFVRLSKHVEAKQFFETARKDAAPDSVLAQLAKQDLELLQQDRTRLLIESDVLDPVVTVKRGTETVTTLELRSQQKGEVLLPAGEYDLEVSGPQQALVTCDAVILPTNTSEPAAVLPSSPQLQPTRLRLGLPQLATATLRLASRWQEPSAQSSLVGIVPKPARLPGMGRWQIKRRESQSLCHLLAWSPDGKLLAVSTQDAAIRLLRTTDGGVESILLGHTQYPHQLSWSPDGLWIASLDFTGALFVWDVRKSRLAFTRSEKVARVANFAWSPDGKFLASAEHGGIAILDPEGTVIDRIRIELGIYGVSWSSDGRRLAIALRDLQQFGIITQDEHEKWSEPKLIRTTIAGGPTRTSWSPDGRLLIAASFEALEVWDVSTWQVINQWSCRDAINCDWERDSNHILISQQAPLVRRYEARGPKNAKPEEIAMNSAVSCAALSPDQRLFARGGHCVIDLVDRQGVLQKTFTWPLPQPTLAVGWSPDGQRLASASGSRVFLHEVVGKGPSLKIGRLLTTYTPSYADISAAKWSPDGSVLAVSSHAGTLSLLAPDGTTMMKRVVDVPLHAFDWTRPNSSARPNPTTLNGVAALPENGSPVAGTRKLDGSAWQLIANNHQSKLQLLTRTGDVRAELAAFDRPIISISASPSGEQVAVSLQGGDIIVVSLKTGEQRKVALNSNVYGLIWSPDEKIMYAAGDHSFVVDVATMKPRPDTPYVGGSISAIAWRGEQRSFFAALRTGHLLELNLKGEIVRTLRQPPGELVSLSLHPDQCTLALGTSHGTVEIWDSVQSKPLGVMITTQHGGCLAVSPTGEPLSLISGKPDANGNAPADELDSLVWIVESEAGEQSMLSAAEFFARQQAAFDRETLARLKQTAAPRELAAAPVQDVGKLSVPEIQEASGLIASSKHEGVFWTISDSGNPANLYALDQTGRVLATYKIAGATNSDWETITLDAQSHLLIGDVGNASRSAARSIYEVDEPDPRAAGAAESSFAKPIELALRRKMTFNAPAPDTDFEASFVLGGKYYLPSKVSSGVAQLFALDLPTAAPEPTGQSIAVELKLLGTIPNANWITDAALHSNGKRLALLTYSEALLFDLPDSGIVPRAATDSALPSPTARVRFEAPFIEASTFDSNGHVLLLSETGTLHRLAP